MKQWLKTNVQRQGRPLTVRTSGPHRVASGRTDDCFNRISNLNASNSWITHSWIQEEFNPYLKLRTPPHCQIFSALRGFLPLFAHLCAGSGKMKFVSLQSTFILSLSSAKHNVRWCFSPQKWSMCIFHWDATLCVHGGRNSSRWRPNMATRNGFLVKGVVNLCCKIIFTWPLPCFNAQP